MKELVAEKLNRGAPGSKGSTSWTGNAEIKDYVSVTGAFFCYLRTLQDRLHTRIVAKEEVSNHTLTPVPSSTVPRPRASLANSSSFLSLLLCGYSYGALTTTRLPPMGDMLAPFLDPDPGTASSEILLRGQNLAERFEKDIQSCLGQQRCDAIDRRGSSRSHASDRTVAMGGEEGTPGSRRASNDAGAASRPSIDAVRRSFDRSRRSIERSRNHLLHRRSSDRQSEDTGEGAPPSYESRLFDTANLKVRTHYLLISPLLGPIASLATMFRFSPPHGKHPLSNSKPLIKADRNNILSTNPTLAIFGDDDVFTSSRRLRRWCEELTVVSRAANPDASSEVGDEGRIPKETSLFQFREIRRAGHFWREEGVLREMRQCMSRWIEEVVMK